MRSLLVLAMSLLGASVPVAAAEVYDVLIRDARVVDGTGNPWFRADVGIRDGHIAFVGTDPDASASHVVDARGRVVAPGFIDVHTHVEARSGSRRSGLEGNPRADNFLLDGVTTIITGNCGGSEIAVGPWFAKLQSLGLGINVATFIGHNSIRREVMGLANRQARPEELEHMQSLVDVAMKEGAIGFSTGLLYVPGTYASTEEVVELARAAARHGGVYASHIREQGAKLHESIEEAVTVGREAGMPVQISHFKIKGKKRWGEIGDALALVHRYREEGVDVVIDAYPYERASTGLSVNLPAWALADGDEAVRKRLADPETRARILKEMREILDGLGFEDYSFGTVARFTPDPSLEGKTLSEINLGRGREATVEDEMETILEMMAEGGASMVYHYMSVEDVETIYRDPMTAVASDGGVQQPGVGKPHPRSYGTNARVLAEFVRERGTLTLEDAVRRMTSLPARTFKLKDRGLLREGFAADLVLFDPDRVTDRATFPEPHQFSEGFDAVLVNGVVAVENGELTDRRGGQIVRGAAFAAETTSN